MMNDLLMLIGNIGVFWHSVVMMAALVIMVVIILKLSRIQQKPVQLLLIALAVSAPVALLFSRLGYWWFARQKFDGAFPLANLTDGGHMLYAAIIGVAVSFIAVYAIAHRLNELPRDLDTAAAAGAAAICIGRMSAFFSNDDTGMVIKNESAQFFPLCIYNENTGEWKLSVFLFEAAAAAITFVLLLAAVKRLGKMNNSRRFDGDIAALFLLSYGTFQAVLESLRSDSLYMVSLGLVRISQLLSAVAIAAGVVWLSVKGVKEKTMPLAVWIILWVVQAALIALAFVMELTLTSETLVRGYAVMSGCVLGVAVIAWLTWLLRLRKE